MFRRSLKETNESHGSSASMLHGLHSAWRLHPFSRSSQPSKLQIFEHFALEMISLYWKLFVYLDMDSCFLEKCKDVQFTDLSFNYWLAQTFVHTCIYTCRQKGDNHIMGNRCKIRELSLKRIFIKTCACHCQVSNYWNLCIFSGCLTK